MKISRIYNLILGEIKALFSILNDNGFANAVTIMVSVLFAFSGAYIGYKAEMNLYEISNRIRQVHDALSIAKAQNYNQQSIEKLEQTLNKLPSQKPRANWIVANFIYQTVGKHRKEIEKNEEKAETIVKKYRPLIRNGVNEIFDLGEIIISNSATGFKKTEETINQEINEYIYIVVKDIRDVRKQRVLEWRNGRNSIGIYYTTIILESRNLDDKNEIQIPISITSICKNNSYKSEYVYKVTNNINVIAPMENIQNELGKINLDHSTSDDMKDLLKNHQDELLLNNLEKNKEDLNNYLLSIFKIKNDLSKDMQKSIEKGELVLKTLYEIIVDSCLIK